MCVFTELILVLPTKFLNFQPEELGRKISTKSVISIQYRLLLESIGRQHYSPAVCKAFQVKRYDKCHRGTRNVRLGQIPTELGRI
jgi:hypothetical protein